MATTLFFSFIASLIICMALIPPLMATAGRLQFVDMPGGRKLHSDPVARVGGIALGIGTFAAILIWAPQDEIVVASLLGGLIILLFGAWDDRVGLNYRIKFLGQLLAAGAVMWLGGVHLGSVPFVAESAAPAWLSVPLTLVVLVGVTNAVNLADGLDGLAGGLTLLSSAGMAYLAYSSGDSVVMLMMVAVLGGLLGFLRFNTYPARIFMGDAGSQFLGFYLGVSFIVLADPARGPYSPMLGLFILGLPLLDTIGVIVLRLLEGRSPFVADLNHLHHRLLALGLSHHEAVLLIYIAQAGMVSLAYLLRWQTDAILCAVYLPIAVSVLALFTIVEDGHGRGGLRTAAAPAAAGVPDSSEASRWLGTLPLHLVRVAVPVFLIISVFLPRHVPRDLGSVAAMLLAVILVGLWVWPKASLFLVRCGLYVGSTFVLYLSEQVSMEKGWPLDSPLNLFFIGLALMVVLTIRFTSEPHFQTTPLDYLMVFLAVMMPVLPEVLIGDINLSLLTAKLIVLFFSFELLLHARGPRFDPLGLVSLWILSGLAVRAWL